MKKLTGLLFICALALLAGCQKSGPKNAPEINAHVIDGGDPATDGIGLYLKSDNTQQIVIPINLPADYQQRGINLPVAVKFVETGQTTYRGFNPHPYTVVYIVSVRKL
ncbi:MAG: membrane lipoprotein lipid attachment site-containing protein [Bacteroidetes bacterium]|nr:membrane lipoprotein lipid attachment site-containing protein [Bacteroidota bacterium]